jgi:protein N-terminal methyltransferase
VSVPDVQQDVVDGSNCLCSANRIGRVTEGLLLPMTESLDVVEPIAKFTVALRAKQGVRQVYTMGLEEWQPEEGVQYDLVWAQWCLGHLTNEQLKQWLERCKRVLTPGTGVIVVKENTIFGGDAFDSVDSTVTR